MEKCFSEIHELEQFRPECEALFSRFKVAGMKRNDLVHGSISDISKKDGKFEFLKIDVKPKEDHSIRLVHLTESDWPMFQIELLDLRKEGQFLAQKIWDSLKMRI